MKTLWILMHESRGVFITCQGSATSHLQFAYRFASAEDAAKTLARCVSNFRDPYGLLDNSHRLRAVDAWEPKEIDFDTATGKVVGLYHQKAN